MLAQTNLVADIALVVGLAGGVLAILSALVGATQWVRSRRRGHPLTRNDFREKLCNACLEDLDALTGESEPIDLPFEVVSPPSRSGEVGCLSEIADLYEGEESKRLVILGRPGAGKTALALHLQLELLRRWSVGGTTPLPVRVSMSAWPDDGSLRECVGRYMHDAYEVDADAAIGALAVNELALLLDGLDEMDNSATSSTRAVDAVSRINSWGFHTHVPVIVTCQSHFYQSLSTRLADALVIEVMDLSFDVVCAYLDAHPLDTLSWSDVVCELTEHHDGPLSRRLRVPYWLNTAVTVCSERAEPAGGTRFTPRDLVEMARTDAFAARLLSAFVATKALQMRRWRKSAERSLRYLARYLEASRSEGSALDGQPLGGPDIVVHRLWPIAGKRRVLNVDTGLATVMSAPSLWWIGQACVSLSWIAAVMFCAGLIPYTLALRRTSRASAIPPKQIHLGRLVTPAGLLQAAPPALLLAAGGAIGQWALAAAAATALWVALGLTLGVSQALVNDGPANPVEPDKPLRDELIISSACGAAVLPLAMLYLGGKYGPAVGVPIALSYCLLVGLTVASAPWRRYVALLIASRRHLPWRLRSFLAEAQKVGLLRRAGIAYQFRHSELQQHLARDPELREPSHD